MSSAADPGIDLSVAGTTPSFAGAGATGPAADFDYAAHYADAPRGALQLKASNDGASLAAGEMHAAAGRGMEGPSMSLPFAAEIQRAFGPAHDVSAIQAHVGGDTTDAAASMGAQAYAMGDHVAFAGTPDLHTAAHEAAHVIQQAQGVNLYGGVGEAGDAYERHADAVADRVVAGQSAADLLAPAMAHGGGGGGGGKGVQLKPTVAETKKAAGDAGTSKLLSEDLTLVARDIYAGAGALDKGADDIVRQQDEIEDEEKSVREEDKKIKELQRTDDAGSHAQQINKHREIKRRFQEGADGDKTNMQIAKDGWVTKITKALVPAQQKLGQVMLQVDMYHTDPQEIATGLSYVRNTLARYRDLCGRMNLSVPALEAMQGQVDEIFRKEKIVGDRVSINDLERMGDDKTVAAQNLEMALDAIQAQVEAAKVSTDMVHQVGLLSFHMQEAVELMDKVDPAERKKIKGRVNTVAQQVKSVNDLAVKKQINAKLTPLATDLQKKAAAK